MVSSSAAPVDGLEASRLHELFLPQVVLVIHDHGANEHGVMPVVRDLLVEESSGDLGLKCCSRTICFTGLGEITRAKSS